MGKRGPKKRFETPEDLRKAVEAYIDTCEAEGIFPDYAGMRLALGIAERTLNKYTQGDSAEAQAYAEALEYAKDKRESWLVRKMTSDNKAAQGCLNALKQPSNGGYIDRPQESGEKKLIVSFQGNMNQEDFK